MLFSTPKQTQINTYPSVTYCPSFSYFRPLLVELVPRVYKPSDNVGGRGGETSLPPGVESRHTGWGFLQTPVTDLTAANTCENNSPSSSAFSATRSQLGLWRCSGWWEWRGHGQSGTIDPQTSVKRVIPFSM